jgi:hypothetical protein
MRRASRLVFPVPVSPDLKQMVTWFSNNRSKKRLTNKQNGNAPLTPGQVDDALSQKLGGAMKKQGQINIDS